MRSPNPLRNNSGYTLVEAVIAMAILLVALVPSMLLFTGVLGDHTAQDKLTALCILEQETARVTFDPSAYQPEKRLHVNKRDWIVTTEFSGTSLVKWHIAVQQGSKVFSEATFYKSARTR